MSRGGSSRCWQRQIASAASGGWSGGPRWTARRSSGPHFPGPDSRAALRTSAVSSGSDVSVNTRQLLARVSRAPQHLADRD